MTEENTSGQSASNQMFSVPIAIVVAGALIAGAIYFGGGAPTTGGSPTGEGAGPAAAGGAEAPPIDPQAEAVIGDIRPVTDDDHIRGAANAKVTVIEYSDIECPFCKQFHPTMVQLLEEFPNDVRWVYRHFPLESLHPNARIAAIATECAADQGKFWELADYLFENVTTGAELAESNLPALAASAGVTNNAAFTNCLESKEYSERIDEDLADAQVAGGRGTPYSVIIGPNGETEPISGAQPYSAVKAAVEKYL